MAASLNIETAVCRKMAEIVVQSHVVFSVVNHQPMCFVRKGSKCRSTLGKISKRCEVQQLLTKVMKGGGGEIHY